MPGKTKTSKSNESYFKAYNYDKNKKIKLEKHLKKHPNDKTTPGIIPNYRIKKKS